MEMMKSCTPSNHCNFSSCTPWFPINLDLPHTNLDTYIFHAFEKTLHFPFSSQNSSSRVIHSVLCVQNLPAFEVPLHR